MNALLSSVRLTRELTAAVVPRFVRKRRRYRVRRRGLTAVHDSMYDPISSPEQRRGRPRIALGNALFAAVMNIYGTVSRRRPLPICAIRGERLPPPRTALQQHLQDAGGPFTNAVLKHIGLSTTYERCFNVSVS